MNGKKRMKEGTRYQVLGTTTLIIKSSLALQPDFLTSAIPCSENSTNTLCGSSIDGVRSGSEEGRIGQVLGSVEGIVDGWNVELKDGIEDGLTMLRIEDSFKVLGFVDGIVDGSIH